MDRTGYVIRTPKGETNVNKLRLPEFGTVSLQLNAAGKLSAAYVPKGAKAGGEAGSDDFHFLPEHESIEIHYHISNPTAVVKGATLELFSRYETAPLWTLKLHELGESWIRHGKHVVKWDGRIPAAKSKIEGSYDKGKKTWSHDLTRYALDKTNKSFPDGYVTLEHAPYKLKITLTSSESEIKGKPTIGWTYFHILLKGLELELGPEEVIPAATVNDAHHKMDKALRKQIETDGGLPAAGSTREVRLISNLFKTASAEMNTNAAFTTYQALWGEGPNIPIVAKIRLLDSQDQEVKLEEPAAKGAVALGKVQFLWEWLDEAEDVTGTQDGSPSNAKNFVNAAINYYKNGTDPTRSGFDHTYPKGDNCHVDRGGKRGPNAKPVFPAQAGYAPKDALEVGKFPFKVTAGASLKNRKWASLSEPWGSGKLKGRTGVVFQPSRMAGDDYTLKVYLSFDKDDKKVPVLDSKDEPLKAPASVQQATGKWLIRREVHIVRYIRKKSNIAAFMPGRLGAIQAFYKRTYIDVKNTITANDNYVLSDHRKSNNRAPDYNKLAKDEISGSGNRIVKAGADEDANHASVDSVFLTRDYDVFVKELHLAINGKILARNDFSNWATEKSKTEKQLAESLATAAVGDLPSNARRRNRLIRTKNELNNKEVHTKAKYARYMDKRLAGLAIDLAANGLEMIKGGKTGGTKPAADGIVIVHFNFSHTYLRDLKAAGVNVGSLLGVALSAADAKRSKCAFLFFAARDDTFAHEIGHHMFMPHAPFPSGDPPGGNQPKRHDDADPNCLMSYNRPRKAFCGLCSLRLRGWDAGEKGSEKLHKTAASNTKP